MLSDDTRTLHQRLRTAGVLPTLQRMAVAGVLLREPRHMTAEQVLRAARELLPPISRATVYSVLQLFVRRGLLKELPIAGAATVYDSNVAPHHHLYNVDTGEVSDLPSLAVRLDGLPELPAGLTLDEVDVIVRVRQRRPEAAAPA
ncbi:Fur family transcriptional regulator [Piscinibacter sp.]|uniref:Fur family transcriptional regulator n=1 Tax=Piscinibacter sp. TaxID=1903157 RepID=UPI0039E248A4